METLKVFRAPPNKFSDVCYQVGYAFVIGFRRSTLLTGEIYITLQPLPFLPSLSVSDLRYLRRLFDKYTGDAVFWCEVSEADAISRRFAEFFRFRPTANYAGRICYVRDN